MSNTSYATILIALIAIVCISVIYLRSLMRGGGFWKKSWAWLKNVIDSLWGMS